MVEVILTRRLITITAEVGVAALLHTPTISRLRREHLTLLLSVLRGHMTQIITMLLHPAVVLGFQHRRAKRGVALLAPQLAAGTQQAGQWLLGRVALVALADKVVGRALVVAAERVGILGQVAQAHRAAV